MEPLTYSENVPTVPGWYWRRDGLGQTVIQLPKLDNNGPKVRHIWPLHWRETFANKTASYPQKWRDKALQGGSWRIEYAGPIEPPK